MHTLGSVVLVCWVRDKKHEGVYMTTLMYMGMGFTASIWNEEGQHYWSVVGAKLKHPRPMKELLFGHGTFDGS